MAIRPPPNQDAKRLPALPAPISHKGTGNILEEKSSEPDDKHNAPLFVVGIGSSAGGIETIAEFLSGIPRDTRLAFVFVQHMSPDFKTMLPEILSNQTGHQITLATEGTAVMSGGFYLIPPDKMMTIFHGRLLLSDRDESVPSSFFPIDHFFDSLAKDLGSRAVGVILSGTGSDGTKGAKAIRDRSGYVIVLTPGSARFSGMPKSAISSNAANAILPIGEIANCIDQHALGIQGTSNCPQMIFLSAQSTALDKAFLQLRNHFGIDFSSYREDLILRRMERRAKIVGCEKLADYCEHITKSSKELGCLFDDFLLGVTEFNRHPESLKALKDIAVLDLLKHRKAEDIIRIWVVGCSTGEEAFTIAFILSDAIQAACTATDFKIFATDIDDKALRIASRASYPAEKIAGLPTKWKDSYFKCKEGQAYIQSRIRERVVFANHNVIRDAPFPNINIVTCRNLMIYLKKEAKSHIHQSFQFSLRESGYLLLGPNETIPTENKDFTVLDKKARLFKCTNPGRSRSKKKIDINFRIPAFAQPNTAKKSLEKVDSLQPYEWELYRKLVYNHLPACLIFDEDGLIDYFFGNIKDYLAPITGKASIMLHDVLPEGLENVVVSLMENLADHGGKNSDSLILGDAAKNRRLLDITVADLEIHKNKNKQYIAKFMTKEIVASDEDLQRVVPSEVQARNARLESDLRKSKRELVEIRSEMATVIGQLEASNEELRTTNEELQAGSEELQSTNEELQAVNEELYTVNAECQMRITELSEMSSDVQNIYEVSEIGTLFVDKELRIRKFNAYSQRLFNLLPDDIGRPIENFSSSLKVDFAKQAKKVIDSVKIYEKEVKSKDDVTYLMRVAPYRTEDMHVKGVVLVFIDISALKRAQSRLHRTSDELQMVAQQTSDLIARFDLHGRIVYVNDSFQNVLCPDESFTGVGRHFTDFVHSSVRHDVGERIASWKRNKTIEDTLEVRHVTSSGNDVVIMWHAKSRFDQKGSLTQFVSIGKLT